MEWSGVVVLMTVCCVLGVLAAGGSVASLDGGSLDANPSDDGAPPSVPPIHIESPADGWQTAGEPPEPTVHDSVATQAEQHRAVHWGSDAATSVASVERTAADSQSNPPPFGIQTDQEFDRTEFRIRVLEKGDAQWTFRFRRTIDTQEEREQFDAFAEEFRSEETDFYLSFQEQATDLAEAGAAATDRKMEATEFNRTAERQERLGNEFGVVVIRFRWTDFAVAEDDGTVRMGDVFEGTLFIGESQRLVVEAGDGLQFERVEPDGITSGESLEASDSVTYEGEREFVDGRPRAVFVPVGGTTDGGGGGIVDLSLLGAIAGLVIVATVIAFVFALYQRGVFEDESDDVVAEEAEETPTAGPSPEPDITDEELLTDEDRVVRLIQEQGGRMKQVDIVDETGWSKSKVSMLLSDMEDEGTISKIRVGRENIVALDGHEPELVGSPFDDEER